MEKFLSLWGFNHLSFFEIYFLFQCATFPCKDRSQQHFKDIISCVNENFGRFPVRSFSILSVQWVLEKGGPVYIKLDGKIYQNLKFEISKNINIYSMHIDVLLKFATVMSYDWLHPFLEVETIEVDVIFSK